MVDTMSANSNILRTKEGKRLMKKLRKVELPQEAFFDILRK